MGKIMLNGISYGSATASGVSGVKGNAETSYRTGNVNITTENIGAAKSSIYGDTTVSMGRRAGTTVGTDSFAFGDDVTATGEMSFSFGRTTNANRRLAVAIGDYTDATGEAAVAIGTGSESKSDLSFAYGLYAKSSNFGALAIGKCNREMNGGGAVNTKLGDIFVIGNGTGITNSARSNALRVTCQGDILGTKAFQSSGADYAEFIKPWADGNPDNEDRVGYFVTVRGGLLHIADEGDYIAGIVSGNPSIVGNADEDYYWRYERDAFNRIVLEDVPEQIHAKDQEGNPLYDPETHKPVMAPTGNIIKNARMKLAEGYDPSLQNAYIERKDRKEWDYVGMLGVLPVRDDGTCVPGQFCKCGQGGVATPAASRGFDTYLVIERISDTIVSVILK